MPGLRRLPNNHVLSQHARARDHVATYYSLPQVESRPLLVLRAANTVRRQHVLDRISGVRKGGFLAHRSQSRSEDETEIRDGKDALRTNHQRHSAGDAEALFG